MLKVSEEVRKKNISEYFVNFSQYHRLWLQELAERYKARGEFPMYPMIILPSYYDNPKDKEVALFVAMLIKEDGDFGRIQAIKNLIGKSPWKWFEKREFIRLSIGSERHKRTGGVEHWRIANLMSRLWDECHTLDFEIPNFVNPCITYKQTCVTSIGEIIEIITNQQHCSYFDTLSYLLTDCTVGAFLYKIRLLLLIVASSDGFGLGLWSITPSEVKCPLREGIWQFVKTWFPEYKRIGSIDDAISLFGFERESDFFYAWLGYNELQKRNPKECSYYATAYLRRYELGSKVKKYRWVGIQPEIPF